MPWITKVLLFLIVLAAVGSTRMSATMTGVRGLAESPSSSTNVAGKHRFRYFTYERMQEHLEQLHKKYPQFTSLTTAQKAYGLPSPGECGRASCEQWILRVTDEATLAPKGARDERPEVFFSGALHGDERIGPTTTLEAVRLMTVLAACVDDSLAASLATHPAWLGADPASAGGLCAGLLDPLDELMVRAGGGQDRRRRGKRRAAAPAAPTPLDVPHGSDTQRHHYAGGQRSGRLWSGLSSAHASSAATAAEPAPQCQAVPPSTGSAGTERRAVCRRVPTSCPKL